MTCPCCERNCTISANGRWFECADCLFSVHRGVAYVPRPPDPAWNRNQRILDGVRALIGDSEAKKV